MDWGFVMLFTESNPWALRIAGWDSDGTIRFDDQIMDNSESFPNCDNQWFLDENEFGTDCMYDPHNGRLAYGRNKIAVIFAHYN